MQARRSEQLGASPIHGNPAPRSRVLRVARQLATWRCAAPAGDAVIQRALTEHGVVLPGTSMTERANDALSTRPDAHLDGATLGWAIWRYRRQEHASRDIS